ncbi:MAG: hypothetical protein ACTSRK_08355, partial [Promethearchaeota archaeon]
ECKWKSQIHVKEIAKKMYSKLPYIQVKKLKEKKPIFIIFGKTFKSKIDQFQDIKVICYDLKDLEKKLDLLRP